MAESGASDASRTLGVVLPRDLRADLVVEFARSAERHGFDELWVVEDLGYRGGIAQAAVALSVTNRLRVGIGILPAGARHVAFTAMEIATLAELFPGRIDAGVGHGMPMWMRSLDAWPDSPLTLLGEYVSGLRAILRGDRVPKDARYVHVGDVTPVSPPAQVPDVLVGARGPKSLELSARLADGTILAEPATPEYIRSVLARSTPPAGHRMVAYNVAAVADTDDAAIAEVRSALAVMGDADWAPHIESLDFADALVKLRRESESAEDFAARMPVEWVHRLSICGTADTARARITEIFRAGATSVVLIPVGTDPVESLARLARVIDA